VASLFYTVLSTDGGAVNQTLAALGIVRRGVPWLADGRLFWPVITFAQIWKTVGWNAIVYLAAITAIDPELYEAASVDGLGRLGKTSASFSWLLQTG
jgi:putative aldouronate transport system permease protein